MLFAGIEYGAAAAQQGDLADHLLQQCLVPGGFQLLDLNITELKSHMTC